MKRLIQMIQLLDKHMRPVLLMASIALSLAAASNLASAHGGEDHGEAAAPVPASAAAPRASAQTEEFELLAVFEGKRLLLTLDRFATNAPVADAQIEVESAGILKAVALQVSPGVYAVSVPEGVFAKPGKYPLEITVQAGELADLMSASLEIAPSASPGGSPGGILGGNQGASPSVWAAAALLILGALALAAFWRRKTMHRINN